MNTLSYETLKQQHYDGYLLQDAPERILQFGEGNFLRAFADYFIDILNETQDFDGKIVVVQPTGRHPENKEKFVRQDCLYTQLLRGLENGEKKSLTRVISAFSRCLNSVQDWEEVLACAKNPNLRYIISNTTETGIRYDASCQLDDAPAASYPGKLTQFLYARYQAFKDAPGKGFILLPCELIEDNGPVLKETVLRHAANWKLDKDFVRWIEEENYFCSTLVDRIVTGYPKQEAEVIEQKLGYHDALLNTSELFGFWVIEPPKNLEENLADLLPFPKAGLPVLYTDNHKPYKQRKVRILNGAHTSMVPGAYLTGKRIVRDCMQDPVIAGFLTKAVYEEIIPTLDLPLQELTDFADAVKDRFSNPFIDHALSSIVLYSTEKWRQRVLPSLKIYIKREQKLPICLTASLAFYLAFYRDETSPINDEPEVLALYKGCRQLPADQMAEKILSDASLWGDDLTAIDGLLDAVCKDLAMIENEGAYALMKQVQA